MVDFYERFRIGDKVEIKLKNDLVLKGFIKTMGTIKGNDLNPPKCTSLSIDILDSDKKKEIEFDDIIDCCLLENNEI